MKGHLNRTRQMVLISIMIAIITIQTWIPGLGNIPLPGLSITYIHVTVIVASLLFDWKTACVLGFTWGFNSWLRAVIAPPNPMYTLVFISPLVSLLPRVLMVIFTHLFGQVIAKLNLKTFYQDSLVGIAGTILNTGLVLGAIALFKASEFTSISGADTSQVWLLLGAIIATNAVPEMIVGAILTPILTKVLRPLSQRRLS